MTVELESKAVAYPYDILHEVNVINDIVSSEEIVIIWAQGTASALDANVIPDGRDVGATVAYSRVLDDQVLDFEFRDGKIFDIQTGSEWNILGLAIAGEL